MRPKGLTDLEIKQIINFDWNNSDDEEDEEEEEELYDSNLEKFIEETMDKVMERGENVEINLIDGIVGEDEHADEEVENVADTENIAEVSYEKINLKKLRWRNAGLTVFETAWKEDQVCREVKVPIKYFNEFFDDEIINKICNETNLYSMQTKGVELNCSPFEIRRFFGVLLYLGIIQVPNLRMAWMPNFRLTAVADSISRARFEKIKESSDMETVNQRKRGRPLAALSSIDSDSSSPSSPAPSNISNVSSQGSSQSTKRSYISKPPKSMRLDQVGHWVEWGAKGRCRLCHTGIPKSKCSKCKVHLCCNPQKNCFVSYHT